MFGTNSANRKQPVWDKVKGRSTYKIDGDLYNLNWVDWNSDRHQDGWLTYMNVGEETWRTRIESRIAHVKEPHDSIVARSSGDAGGGSGAASPHQCPALRPTTTGTAEDRFAPRKTSGRSR